MRDGIVTGDSEFKISMGVDMWKENKGKYYRKKVNQKNWEASLKDYVLQLTLDVCTIIVKFK